MIHSIFCFFGFHEKRLTKIEGWNTTSIVNMCPHCHRITKIYLRID